MRILCEQINDAVGIGAVDAAIAGVGVHGLSHLAWVWPCASPHEKYYTPSEKECNTFFHFFPKFG